MAVTRIQNNQITDGTVVAYAKLQAGSLTGNLFAPSVTLNSNVTINGNLFLSNAGNVTTINATNTYINDPLVMFNNGYTGSLTGYDIGILVNRNLASLGAYGSVNTFLGWVEADSAFETLATTDTGTGITSINNAGYANFKTGNATLVSGTVTGTLGVTGATTLTTATTGGLQAVAIGNATPGTAVFTTATTGGLQAVAIGNVTPGTGVFTTGTFNTATTGGLQAVAIGNVTPGTGAFTTASTTGNLTVGGNIAITGNIVPSANVTYSLGTLNSRFKDIFLSGSTIYAGGFVISEETSGNLNLTANNGNRLQILGTAANVVQATGNVVAPFHLGSLVGASATITTSANITGTGASTNSTSGALVVMGGAGVAGQIYAGGIQNTPIGGTTASTATFTTATTGGLQAVAIGNVTPGTATFTTATTGGLQAVAIGNATPGTATFTTATTGGLQAVAIGNATPGSGAFTTGTFSSTLGVTGATTMTTATTGGLQAVAIGNATPGTGAFTTATTGGLQATAIGNVTAGLGYFTTATATTVNAATIGNTGATFSGATATLTGNVSVGNLTTAGSNGNISGVNTVFATLFSGSGASLTNLQASAVQGTVATANVANYIATTAVSANQTYYVTFADKTAGNVLVDDNSSLTFNPSTGTLTATYFSGTLLGTVSAANVAYYENITPLSNNQTYYLPFANVTTGNSTLGATTSVNVNPSTGAVYSTSANTTTLNAGGTADIAGVTKITNATQTSGASSGALQVTGGASVGGNLYVGGWSTLNGNVTIGGNLSVSGQSVSIGASTLSIVDPIISLNTPADLSPLTVVTTSDIGIKFHYYDTSDQHAFLGRAVDTGYLEWYSRGNDTANVFIGTVYGTIKPGALVLANAKTVGGGLSANTGTLQVWGDGAINGNLFVGGTLVVPAVNNTIIGNATASTAFFTTANATNVYAATIGNVGTSLNGTGTNITGLTAASVNGTVATANVSLYDSFTATTTNATFYPQIVDKTTGNGAGFTASTLTHNPSTGALTATSFNGIGTFSTGTFSSTLGITGATTMTTATTGGLQAVAIGNVTPGTGAFTTLSATGATTMTTATTGGLQAVAIGNATPGTGAFTTATTGGLQAVAIGNATPGTGAFTTLTGGSFQGIIGNATATTGFFTTATATTVNAATVGNIGANVVGTGTYLTSLTGSNVNGTVATANVSLYNNITPYTTNQTFYLQFANVTNGNTSTGAVTTVNVNPSTGNVYANAFVGSGLYLTGVATAGAGNVSFYQQLTNSTTNASFYIPFYDKATGNASAYTNTALSFRPSDGYFFATVACVGTIMGTTINADTTITASGAIRAFSGVASTSTSTGALQVQGGAGVTGNVNIGGILNVAGNVAFDGGQTTHYDSIIDLHTYGNLAAWAADDGKDIGVRMHYYNGVDSLAFMGLENSTKTFQFLINATEVAGNVTGTFGNAQVGSLVVSNTTQATGTTASTGGALYVAGGVGISGNVFHANSTIMNSSQTAGADTIIRGKNDATLLWARPNATYDTVIIGNSATASTVVNGAKLAINTTDSILLPVGTSAQRPGSQGYTDTTGMFRFSSTVGAIEWYNGTSWQSASTQFTVIADQQFTGTGSQTAFTLSSTQTTASCIVSINGVVQIPTLAYSVTSTTLTFTEAPANGEVIDVRMLTTTSTVAQLYDTSGYNTVNTVTGTGITFTTGSSALTTQYTIDTRGAMVTNGSNVTVASAGTSTIDTLFANAYSSAKYTITATLQGTNIREINEVLLVHNGDASSAGTATVLSYGKINTAGNTLVTFGGSASGNIAQLQATTTNANTILRIKRDYQAL